ncbi:MAG: hypothetical protein PHE25_06370 [Candidatus Gracilibacteria bacterium]|nr:hypothetical protein [Candidatus Gracilibacteria bacterium]
MKNEFEDKLVILDFNDFPPDFSIRTLYEHGLISKEKFEKGLRKIKIKEIERNLKTNNYVRL